MIGEDHNKPYYTTVKSSSEGELSSDNEDDALKKLLPKPSEKQEEELRQKLLRGRDAREISKTQDPHLIHPSTTARNDDHSSRREEDRRNKDHRRNDQLSRSKSPPPIKKRPAIRAPTPEIKEKQRRSEDRCHQNLDEKATRIVIQEEKTLTATSTPTFSGSPSPKLSPKPSPKPSPKDKSPVNPLIKSLAISQSNRSNTSSPMPEVKKYSRFDSPEPESPEETEKDVDRTVEISTDNESDAEHATEVNDENMLQVLSKNFEDLTEEEKGMLSPEKLRKKEENYQRRLIARLPVYYPGIYGCRSVNEFKLLNRISEGTFGVVYRAKERSTDEVVALKQLKMEKEKEGFPITSLREINMLMKCRRHPNVVGLREIVTDATGEKIYMVMEFVEHELRTLMKQLEVKKKRFKLSEVKALMQQLLSGIAYMHGEWVIHRDLKTANLLLSHKNILKIGDFGLAREYGDPLKPYTSLVVTLHYRSPELLLGCKTYSTAVDIWSVGCIFGELFKLNAIWPAKSEAEQVKLIFEGVGTPNEKTWPGYKDLQYVDKFVWPNYQPGWLHRNFHKYFKDSKAGMELLKGLLNPCPEQRISAEEALEHQWFTEDPQPAPPETFPTWPTITPSTKNDSLKARPKQLEQQQKQPPIDPERAKLLQEFNIKPTKATMNVGNFQLKLGR